MTWEEIAYAATVILLIAEMLGLGFSVLREAEAAYTRVFGTENSVLSSKNATFWTENPVRIKTYRGPTLD